MTTIVLKFTHGKMEHDSNYDIAAKNSSENNFQSLINIYTHQLINSTTKDKITCILIAQTLPLHFEIT
jgi:hypothetical protein